MSLSWGGLGTVLSITISEATEVFEDSPTQAWRFSSPTHQMQRVLPSANCCRFISTINAACTPDRY